MDLWFGVIAFTPASQLVYVAVWNSNLPLYIFQNTALHQSYHSVLSISFFQPKGSKKFWFVWIFQKTSISRDFFNTLIKSLSCQKNNFWNWQKSKSFTFSYPSSSVKLLCRDEKLTLAWKIFRGNFFFRQIILE